MKVAIITPAIADPARLFGAERHFLGMVRAFQSKVPTDWIQMPLSETRWESILQGYLDAYDLDLAAYDLVVSTKSPTYMAQHPNHICWLLHQVRVFYDRFDDEYSALPAPALAMRQSQRAVIQRLDTLGLSRVRHIVTNGQETARRLKHYNGLDAEVLHPPVLAQGHYCGARQEYFLLPGRLHRWKRVDMAVRAMQHLRADVPLLIAGEGEDEYELRRLAGNDPRIKFLGFVDDAQLLELYANALAVLFLPKEEDFGYITIEAMLSHKPVIVCTDSGEPAQLVQSGRSGFVVSPDPGEIARAMEALAADRELARSMGEHGFTTVPYQSWDETVERLLEAGAVSSAPVSGATATRRVSMLVADNQVLDPPVGGGRIRIYELYRQMARQNFDITYVGAYDWPGPAFRDRMLTPHFREIVTPLTQPHFAHNRRFEKATGGKTTIDVTIPKLLHLSPRYRRLAEEYGRDASVIVISHPWVYPHVPRRAGQQLVYDAHNVEYVVKKQILGSTAEGKNLAEEVREVEGNLCRDADLVFACSEDDARQFVTLYGISEEKIVLVPNGVDVEGIYPATPLEREAARQELQIAPETPAMIFIGSGYGPNTEAAAFLVKQVAPRLPHCKLLIAGGVRDSYFASGAPPSPANVEWLGTVDAERRLLLYHAADLALNPMFSGSGTNLKMLDYFAAGLAVVSTPAGARGLELKADDCVVCPPEEFPARIEEMLTNDERRESMGANARRLAVDRYSWAMIATHASAAIAELLQGKLAHVS